MSAFLSQLAGPANFRGPEYTGLWPVDQIWMHAVAELLLFGVFAALAGMVFFCAQRRKDLPIPIAFRLLGVFFLACGLACLGQVLLLWAPDNWLAVVLEVVAALVGTATVAAVIPLLPRILALSSPQELQRDIARRTQELRDSEARLRAIFETAEDGILTLNEDWIVLTVNPVCERLFGLPVERIIEQPFTNFILGPESKSAVKKQVGTGEGKVFGMAGDVLGKRADGSTFQASLSISKVQLDQGTIFTAIIHDLSAFKRTQEALRQSEARLRMMLAQVPAVLCTTDRKLRITLFASSAITGLSSTGFHISRFSGMSLVNTTDETLRSLPAPAFRQALEGTPGAVSVRWKERIFQFHVQALRDTERQIIGAIGIGLDVTDQKRIEAALRRSEATIRAIIEAAGDGILTFKESGEVRLANPACEKLFGYKQDELIGRNASELIGPPDTEKQRRPLREYLADSAAGQPFSREMVGRRQNGETFPLHLTVSPVDLKKRRLFVGIVHDQAEQKKAEQALQFYARQLQERNDQLSRSNQELDEFAYVASHDLKEPLRGIHHYCVFLIEDYGDKLDAEGKAKLERLQYLAGHLSNLIDSLLQFSRVGRVDLAVQDSDLNQVVEEVLDSLRISLQQQEVEVRIRERLPIIRCDRVRIAEVFRNLITNAMKYNDKPEKWLEIGEANKESLAGIRPIEGGEPGMGPSRIFYVRDNGIGIPQKHWDTIFRIFKRLHGRDKFGGGTGAGLTIVKKIIERHGGQVFLQSAPGEGTTFFFTIPEQQTSSATETAEQENPPRNEP